MDSIPQGKFPIVKKKNLAKDVYDFTFYCPEAAAKAKEGQFLHIAVPGHFLRRPISICSTDKENGLIRIVFAVKGEGTARLSELLPGDAPDVLGPLGHGFTLFEKDKKVILAGGGIGVPPLLTLSSHYGKNAFAACGFRDAKSVILEEDFIKNGTRLAVCTDDGSYGLKGTVITPLENIFASGEKFDMVYSCGPVPMMRAVAEISEKYGIPCEVSLEQRMGCGIGACLVCSCKIKKEGRTEYLHVCKNGPVFNAREVVW